MSQVPSTSTPHPNFDSIFNSALDAYKQRVKQDLTSHPLLPRLQACNSPDAVLTVLREQVPTFGQSHSGDGNFGKWLVPTVNVLYAFSAAIGEGAGLVFSPARSSFRCRGSPFDSYKCTHQPGTLIEIFSRIESVFKRLETYIEVPPTTAMMDIIIKIMVEVLSILGIATKEMKRGRTRKFLTKLIGRTDVEDSLQRLDKLTQEEAQMAAAELRTMMHKVDCKVVQVEESVQSVGRAVGGVDDKVEQVNRNHLRDNLRTWLSPSNPSTNHNIACDVHHEGSAQWFFRGSIYNQWKSTGSLLWVHGKRAFS
ncbi:hypothetical protein BC826DRAFT_135052 [Russula brevipes]|nr:hypothetical protein BC826DRAFT_135052 [Russula brevipes]